MIQTSTDKSQTERLYDLLLDGKPHCTNEIMFKIYGDEHLGLARVGARIWDIKRKYRVNIISNRDPVHKSLWWYQLIPESQPISSSFSPAYYQILEEAQRMEKVAMATQFKESLMPKLF